MSDGEAHFCKVYSGWLRTLSVGKMLRALNVKIKNDNHFLPAAYSRVERRGMCCVMLV